MWAIFIHVHANRHNRESGLWQCPSNKLRLSVELLNGLELNPFTPKSDQVQISPTAFPVILHHTVWRTWLFIAYSYWKMIILPILTTSLTHFSLKGWENVLFELNISCVSTAAAKNAAFFRKWSVFRDHKTKKTWNELEFSREFGAFRCSKLRSSNDSKHKIKRHNPVTWL